MLSNEIVPEDGYAAFDRLAATAAPGCGGVIFTPWLAGERAPLDDGCAGAWIQSTWWGAARAMTFDKIQDRARIVRSCAPEEENRALYDRHYAEFVRFYRANRKSYARLNGVAAADRQISHPAGT